MITWLREEVRVHQLLRLLEAQVGSSSHAEKNENIKNKKVVQTALNLEETPVDLCEFSCSFEATSPLRRNKSVSKHFEHANANTHELTASIIANGGRHVSRANVGWHYCRIYPRF